MPTERHGKVRRMLRAGMAHVVRRTPFTIQLDYDSTLNTQPVNLGIDAGSTHIGISATTLNKELYAAELILRTDIVKLLATRRELRRKRRNRLRYRASRFNNRTHAKGRIAPSIYNKVNTHIKVIAEIHKILPITKTIIEVGQFDTQKLNNPSISADERQHGIQFGFWNVREYVLTRDHHQCQHCKGKSKDPILNVHHIESRKTGGNNPGNLITLCESCHKAYHNGKIKLKIKRSASLREAAVMNVMRWEVYNKAKTLFNNVHLTYGYITKYTRIQHGLEKGHAIDARCISENPSVTPLPFFFQQKQTRRHNRQIYKSTFLKGGKKKNNQSPYIVRGFRLFDKVLYNKTECFVFARRATGLFNIRLLDGTIINASINCKNFKLIEPRKTILTTIKQRTLPTTIKNENSKTDEKSKPKNAV